MAAKSPQAFRTIREVADWLGVEAHVLRFWESKFSQIKPVKRAGGRRYYRPADMQLVGGIKVLLHDQGLTIRGVQKLIREEGVAHVSALSPALAEDLASGEVIELSVSDTGPAAPEPAAPIPAAGFFDLDAMAGPQDSAPAPETANADPQGQSAGDAPADPQGQPTETTPAETVAAAVQAPAPPASPAPSPADSEETAPEDALAALRALITRSGSLDAARIAELAPHLDRLQALADRLAARSRAA